jgi:hypothetical protein
MLVTALLFIAAADVPQALLDRSDEASGAYISCLFGVMREANAAHASTDEFERRLAGSCTAEENLVRQLDTRIFTLRGNRNPAAKSEALIRQTRQGMVAQYRQLPEQERTLQELARLCREHPDGCRN